MKKHIFELVIIFILVATLSLGAFADTTQKNISEKLIRLHVIANSDTQEDQEVKLKVRDRILEYVTELTEGCSDISEAREKIEERLPELTKIAESVLSSNGFDYSAKAELSDEFFPTREYGSFSLPAGDYNALRIHLGKADGKNWWCVLFPPLCLSAAEAETVDLLETSGLSENEIKLMTSDDIEYKYKFGIVEFFQNLFS